MITTMDVRWGCDVLRPVYDASGGVDGRVSIEVDPRLAQDAERTVAEARQLWWLVDRPNLFIKIPATRASLPAISQCLAEGISVNVTLIFSIERYRAVMDAFIDGMERARVAGHDLTNLASVASFFVSRVDTEVDKRLEKLGLRRGRRAARQGGDRQRPARLPGLRGGLRRRALVRAGRRQAPSRSGRCGHPPASRTRRTTTRCTSSTWSPPAW